MCKLNLLAATATLVLGFSASAQNAIYFQSQPGDPVLNGASGVELNGAASDTSFHVTELSDGGVSFQARVISTNQQWYLGFSANLILYGQSSTRLQPGVYENAIKQGNALGVPGIDVYRSPVNCIHGFGRFTVHEIEYGTTAINKLAVDFEWHCAGADPALFGGVRYNSSIPYVPRTLPPVQLTPAAIYLSSTPGDPVLGGQRITLTNEQGLVRRMLNSVQGARITVGPGTEPPAWEFGIVEPGPLAPGSFTVGLGPSAWMKRGTARCENLGTRFTVHEVEVVGVVIRKLAADIAFSCDGKTTTSYAGIRYNSSLPYTDPLAASALTSVSGISPAGGFITVAIGAAASSCAFDRVTFVDPRLITPPIGVPPELNLSIPHGFVDFVTRDCGAGRPVTFNVDYSQELPPTAQWWKYGPTPDNHAAHWYTIPSTVNGKRITFTIADGGVGDDDLTANGAIVDTGMLAVPGGMVQDLWWSGAAENGWGLSLVQHRDVLFANVFAYDAQGVATWYVMPSGTWNPDHTVYFGNLYLPRGSPYYDYDGSRFDIGAPVGIARLSFFGANQGIFDYVINGVSGSRNITRVLFGPPAAPTDKPLADLWWAGSAQNGWGIALLQQYGTLFALWFTYDANGKATWFVMPGGSWAAKDDYRGSIYKAVGPPWLGVPYDVSRHRTIESGTFRLRFSGDAAIFDYTLDGKTGSIPLTRIPF
jgi:hypothetical protein